MTRFVLLPIILLSAALGPPGCTHDDAWTHQSSFEGWGFRVDLPPDLFPQRANFRHFEHLFPEEHREFYRSLAGAGDFTSRDLRTKVSFFGTRWKGVCEHSARSVRMIGDLMHDLELPSGRWRVRWQHDPDGVDLLRCVDDQLWTISTRRMDGRHREMQRLAREFAERAELSSPPPRPKLPHNGPTSRSAREDSSEDRSSAR